MRVIQAFPDKVLRMRGGLGPLQSEPATGVLTIAIAESETDGQPTTTIVWEYVVGGYMRYETAKIAKAVDTVMGLQLGSLAEMLGHANMPKAPVEEATAEVEAEAAEDAASEEGGDASISDESDDRMAALEEAVEALNDE